MTKPAHQHIRDWRVVQVGVVIFLCYILLILVQWMVAGPFAALQTWHLAPVTTTVPALVAGLFAIVKTLMQRNEKEET